MKLASHGRSFVVALAASCVGASSSTFAGDFIGIDSAKKLYDLDTASGTTTLLGALVGAPTFAAMDRAQDGTLYATAQGGASGYAIYTIDENALTATLKFNVVSSCTGGVGIAVDPTGNAVWVAGFVGLSLKLRVQRVDLATGVMSDKGQLTGNAWGLGFDDAGELFTLIQGGSGPRLLKLDRTNVANSTVVGGDMLGVDMMLGLDLASSVNTTGLTLYSRSTGAIFSIDTSTGVETLIGNTGVSTVRSFAANDPCLGDAEQYGSGCAGTGGFVPVLDVSGCPQVADIFSIDISNGLGGSSAVLLVGLGQTSVPVGAGCSLFVAPLSPASLTLPLGGVGPGDGSIELPIIVTPIFSGVSFTMQTFVLDPSTGIGAAASNGVELTIP